MGSRRGRVEWIWMDCLLENEENGEWMNELGSRMGGE